MGGLFSILFKSVPKKSALKKAKEMRNLKREKTVTELKVDIASGKKKLKEIAGKASPEAKKKVNEELKKSGLNLSKVLAMPLDRASKILGLRPFEKAFLGIGRGTQAGRLGVSSALGAAVLEDYPQTQQKVKDIAKGTGDIIDKYGSRAIKNIDLGIDALVGRQGGGEVGLKKIPAGPKGEGLRALKKENPSLVREQFKYAKKGGKILTKKKKKKKVKYVGVGKALRGYGSVRRG